MPKKKTYIISLGGSLIVPKGGIDWRFLKKFRQLIIEQVKKGKRFYIIAGGGKTCRDYNTAANKVARVTPDDLDWLGIHASRLNAHLLKTIFHDVAYKEVIKNPTIHFSTDKNILIGGGWKPGWSTDYVATMIAQEYEVKTVINLSNIEYVYDKDPAKYKTAKKIEKIDWKNFRKIVGDKWIPGLNMPFDPIASKKADHLNLKVVIMDGGKLLNLRKLLDHNIVKGTIIK
jgi:uridylate kinase